MMPFVKFIEEVHEANVYGQIGRSFCRTQFIAVDCIESIGFEWVDKPKARVITKSGSILVGTFVLNNGASALFDGLYPTDRFCREFDELRAGT